MNRKLKIVVIMVALGGIFLACPAQQSNTVSFYYDNNGNRIEHMVTSIGSKNNETAMSNHPSTSTILDFFNVMKVGLYPNPTHDKLTLSIQDKPEELTLLFKVTTSTGAVLHEKILTSNQESFDMAELPPGIYNFQLISGDRKHVWKVIKE